MYDAVSPYVGLDTSASSVLGLCRAVFRDGGPSPVVAPGGTTGRIGVFGKACQRWQRALRSRPVGDYFQVIADVEATEAEAPALAESMVHWLVGEGVIMKDLTDCVASGTDSGYPPGPTFRAVVIHPNDDFLTLWANGVEVSTGRRVFHPGQGEIGAVICPRCDQTVQLSDPATGAVTDQWQPFADALNAWYAGGPGLVRCPHCSLLVDFNDWLWVAGRPFAVGFLGLTFWNWPELSALFVQRVVNHLGHRVVLTGGKL